MMEYRCKPRFQPVALGRQMVLVAAALATTQVTLAATFSVTTKIYEKGSSQPEAEHRILFDNGLVYDLPQIDRRLITVYDPGQGQVTLIDRSTQVQTTIRTEELFKVTAQARASAQTSQQKDRIGLEAAVKPSSRVKGHSIQFGNAEYHTTTQVPSDESMAADFGAFVDIALRLDILTPNSLPPFGRLTLNQHIARAGELPLQTTRVMRIGDQTMEHQGTYTVGELTETDRASIEAVRSMLSLYQAVGPREFPH